ncbi:MAG: hydroxyacylglutathione hydrolase [Myxococcota bacterium]|jgi:hydroxyacylglutathione hydrolase
MRYAAGVKITFLGSGGAFTDFRQNYHNNALVETGAGPVLLDCGFTAAQSMREIGVHPGSLSAVLFTHLHADHASPEQIIWERYYSGPHGFPEFKTTRLVAPGELLSPMKASLEHYIGIYSDPTGTVRNDGVDSLVQFEHTREVEIGGVRFQFFRVPHVHGNNIDKAAFGVRITEGDKTVMWSGDTTFSPAWVRRAADDPNVKQIFHECTFFPYFRGTVHSHWDELLTLPDDVRSKITLMHHTSVPDGVDIEAVADAARRHQIFEL